jgi:hypothetical protein
MRLLNVHTLGFEYFPSIKTRPRYAILSHTWGEADDEVSYSDITSDVGNFREKSGFKKIQFACKEALNRSIDYAWIDTCCKRAAANFHTVIVMPI